MGEERNGNGIMSLQSNNIFQMSRKMNKMAPSRFRAVARQSKEDSAGDLSNDFVRFKTEDGQSRIDPEAKRSNKKQALTTRKTTGLSLQNLIKNGNKMRKVCLEKIIPQYKPIMKPVILEPRHCLSKLQKENVRRSILEAVNQTPKKGTKMTEHYQKMIRVSFNRIVKEIKQKNCIRRDDETEVFKNKIEGFGASIKGDKHNVNQDSLVFSDGIYIICDGHGTNGKQISQFVSTLAHKLLQESISEHKMDPTIIKNILKKVEVELQLFGIDIAFSGCTFIGVVVWENTIFVINVGDSRAILCKGLGIVEVSTLHKPDNLIEKQRIELCGGVIHPLQIGKDKYSGPNRIWAPGRCSWGPGLALSRAFGDKAARKFGVISQPEIRTFSMTYEEDFIIMGSDGLFDFMKDSELSFLVRKSLKEESGREEIALKLVEQGRRVGGAESDDISCIVVFL